MERVWPTVRVAWLGVTNSGWVTVNWTPLLVNWFTVAIAVAIPGLIPAGTLAMMVVSLQATMRAVIPLNVPAWHWRDDLRVAPACRRRERPVEADRAAALRRPKIRAGDRY